MINNIDKESRIINVSFTTNDPVEFVDCGTTTRTYSEGSSVERFKYDFVGSQFLGYRDASDNSVSMWNPLSGTEIRNQHFRDWRAANKKGGDFQVFSDLKRTVLEKPDVFTFK